MTSRWYCKILNTVTGQVVNELPLTKDPTWTQQINDPGTWTINTPIAKTKQDSGYTKYQLRGLINEGRFSAAICWGTGNWATDWIAQAGPIWTWALATESPPVLQLGGAGMMDIYRARWQIPSTYNGVGLGDPSATAIYGPLSYQGIAVNIIANQIARSTLPIDVPTAIAGIYTMTYPGYDFATAGQRLTELTQLDKGPDVLFRPYFADASHVRWQALIGNPTLAQPGAPLRWDYGSSLTSVIPSSDGSKLATTSLVKGNGIEVATLWSQASDATLTAAGWTLLETIDTSHSNLIDPTVLQAQATANQKINGRPVEVWTASARVDTSPLLGSYTPGIYATYNFPDESHPIIPKGSYFQRIIGLTNGNSQLEVGHILQATAGAV